MHTDVVDGSFLQLAAIPYIKPAILSISRDGSAAPASQGLADARAGNSACTRVATSHVHSRRPANMGLGCHAGDLSVAAGTLSFIGAALGTAQAVSGLNTFTNEAQGTVPLQGRMQFLGAAGQLSVGHTSSGQATGALRVGSLSTGVGAAEGWAALSVGVSDSGRADGLARSASGDVRVRGATLVGHSTSGHAQGVLDLGTGRLRADNQVLRVGTLGAGGSAPRQASGAVLAAGVSGFSSFEVGTSGSVDRTLDAGGLWVDRAQGTVELGVWAAA